MREALGGISLMSIFIFFFIMVTFFLVGAILYYKGFKINSQIINSLEKYEGYNAMAGTEIDRTLENLGYRREGRDDICGKAVDGTGIVCQGNNSVYDFDLSCETTFVNRNEESVYGQNKYIVYKVKSYVYIQLPMNLRLRIPITTKSKPIYQFKGYENGLGC